MQRLSVAKRQRKYKLEIQDMYFQYRVIEPPITIDFEITKFIQGGVCDCSITLYNLGEATRGLLYKDGIQTDLKDLRDIRLSAGYESDKTLYQMFFGKITKCYSYRLGVEFLTVIECTSGSDYMSNVMVSEIVPRGLSYSDVAKMLSLKVVKEGKRAIGNFNGTTKRDATIHGPIADVVRSFTSGEFFIDDDTVVCISEDEYVTGILNEINSESGLLGSPQKEENFVVFDVIFEPRILLCQKIYLNSDSNKYFMGYYKIMGFKHSGTISDSICGVLKTTIRAIALKDGSQEVLFT